MVLKLKNNFNDALNKCLNKKEFTIPSIYIAVLHYPVYNRSGQVVATSVANMDIHDISRTAKTYGVERFYIVTPIMEQRELVGKILRHWQSGYGAVFNPSRRKAFDITICARDLQEVIDSIKKEKDADIKLVATGAGFKENTITYESLRKEILSDDKRTYLILFGTGSGLISEVIENADFRLEPIMGKNGYNHLSVRSAAAIVLDRLLRN